MAARKRERQSIHRQTKNGAIAVNGKTFLKGAAILGIAGLIVQVMGAVFRIPLANIIGDEGMGYYQTAYPIYIFLLVFSTNGAPAAISKMTSERVAIGRYTEAHRVFQLSFLLMALIGVVTSAAVFFGAKAIVDYLENPGAFYAMAAIAPALLFVPIMSVFRGYFQGYQEMSPTASSQLVEQLIRVAAGLGLAIALVPVSIEYAAAGASAGGSIGPVFGMLFLIFIYFRIRDRLIPRKDEEKGYRRETAGKILGKLASIAVPITIGVSILPVMNIVDVLMVIRRLGDIGMGSEANALYGQLSGMAGPIINIPQAMALSIALSLVPAVASAKSAGKTDFMKQNIRLGFRTALIIGVPCALGLMILSKPIMTLLYPLQMESAVSASGCLFFLATGVIFITVAQTMAGILQGLGKPSYSLYAVIIGVMVKVIFTYLLVGIPSLNVQGAAIASTLAYAAIAFVNFRLVVRLTNTRFNYRLSIAKPLVSGLVMSAVVLLLYFLLGTVLPGSVATVLSIGAGACVYGIMLLRLRAILPDEIRTLPKGESIFRFLAACRLIERTSGQPAAPEEQSLSHRKNRKD